jgi:ABC-type molybdate transport system substrate-binding protein
MTYAFDKHRIDISLGYCSSRQTTPDPKFATVELPPQLAVHADYGMSVLSNREAALRFALFVMSPEAQHVIGMYGFTPVAERYAAPAP